MSQVQPGWAWLVLTRGRHLCLSSISQLEEFLNQSPFYFWMNGDRIDSLMENDRQQSHAMDVMEDSINQASNIMNELFQDWFFPQRPQDTQYYSPFSSFPRRGGHSSLIPNLALPGTCLSLRWNPSTFMTCFSSSTT